jgi:hypothetical protein
MIEHVFDDVTLPARPGASSVEHALTAVLDRSAVERASGVVDRVYPELYWGRRWLHEPDAPRHAIPVDPVDQAGAVAARAAELDRLLAAGAEPLARAAAASREIARLSAVVAQSLAEFARAQPESAFDRAPGEQGAMSAATRAARPTALTEISEWAVDEVAPTLRISAAAANARLADSVVLVERLPRTHALLARGELSPAHAGQMVHLVGPVADDALRADIEAHVLGLLKDKTPPQLGDCARRIVLRRDAEAAGRRLVTAIRERGVRLHDRRDGTGALVVDLPLPVCAAVYRSLEAHAEQLRVDGDERTKQQRMADCLADLVLRPGEHGLPPVTIALTLVATLETMLGGAEPGQVDGHLVPAEVVRELAYTFGLLPRPAPDLDGLVDEGADDATVPGRKPDDDTPARPLGDPAPEPTPVADRPLSEWMALVAARHEEAVAAGLAGAAQAIEDGVWTDGELRAVLDLGDLVRLRDVAGTGLAHRPHIAVVDQLRGSLVTLTDATAIRRGQALGPPPPTDGHDPGADLERFVKLRDKRCRFPGCRARARVCDLDHRCAWPHGPTAHDNLCCLCEHHHRLKHQAPGWRFEEAEDGGLAVTLPNGEVRVSHPPRFGTDLDVPPY